MRSLMTSLLCGAVLLTVAGLFAQQEGPVKDTGNTVAKPKKSTDNSNPAEDPNLPKIPSQYKKEKQDLGNVPNFKLDVDVVTLDVAILDNKGQFIPGIPAGNFRILEDNVPQQVRKVDMGEAPLT